MALKHVWTQEKTNVSCLDHDFATLDFPSCGLGCGCIGARNDATQQSGQTQDKKEIKNITVYVSGYTETDTTGMLSPPTVWRQQSEFVSSRESGQIQ